MWQKTGRLNSTGFTTAPVKELTTKRDAKSALDSRIPSQIGVLKLCSKPSWQLHEFRFG